ncbi:MAG TPA: hypothetical protein VFG76_13355 [Candidatus Polarisedimenticolia bacterium]|nr:hypothetical protein [Candidatus Polarisedimenticolia bacterium]
MRGNGRNHNFVIQTRQKDDVLLTLSSVDGDPIAAAGELVLKVRRVEGYSQIRFLAFGEGAFSLRIEQGPNAGGPFVQTQTLASAAGPGGEQLICTSIEPCGSFMRLTVVNGPTEQAPELKVLGHPV